MAHLTLQHSSRAINTTHLALQQQKKQSPQAHPSISIWTAHTCNTMARTQHTLHTWKATAPSMNKSVQSPTSLLAVTLTQSNLLLNSSRQTKRAHLSRMQTVTIWHWAESISIKVTCILTAQASLTWHPTTPRFPTSLICSWASSSVTAPAQLQLQQGTAKQWHLQRLKQTLKEMQSSHLSFQTQQDKSSSPSQSFHSSSVHFSPTLAQLKKSSTNLKFQWAQKSVATATTDSSMTATKLMNLKSSTTSTLAQDTLLNQSAQTQAVTTISKQSTAEIIIST